MLASADALPKESAMTTKQSNPHNITLVKHDNGKWAVEMRRTFTNQRLVRHGGEAYTDREHSTAWFPTLTKAIAYATSAIAHGWEIKTNRNGRLVLVIDTTTAAAS